MDPEVIVATVVSAAGGKLTGRVRLQKTVYLLDRLGLKSGFQYEYHHYGPYSRELDSAVLDAKAFDLVRERFEHRQSDGAMYSVFEIKGEPSTQAYGDLDRNLTVELTQKFSRTNVTVLELAATVDWLRHVENVTDWRAEITRRKGVKVGGGRLDRAIALLEEIGLSPNQG